MGKNPSSAHTSSGGVEGVVGVYHILPGLFCGELSVEGGESLYWSLFYFTRVDVGSCCSWYPSVASNIHVQLTEL